MHWKCNELIAEQRELIAEQRELIGEQCKLIKVSQALNIQLHNNLDELRKELKKKVLTF